MRDSSVANFSWGQISSASGTVKATLMRNLCIVVSCFSSGGGFSSGGIQRVLAKFSAVSCTTGVGVPRKLVAFVLGDCVIFTCKGWSGCVQPVPQNS
eukprot:8018762-Ditylum_brightwellii.AAC.1